MAKPKVVDVPVVAPRHGRLQRRHPVRSLLKYVAIGAAVMVVAAVGVVGITVLQLTSSISTVDLPTADGEPPNFAEQEGGFNVLLVGSDSREGQDSVADGYEGGALNDVTMLLHVSEDHTRATVVSFPRDLILNFPSCPATEEGGEEVPAAYEQQLNTALERGGLACVAAVVGDVTGLDIPYAALIDFDGVVAMSSAVGGVPVCFAGPIHDPYTGLEIPEAGTYDLEGEQALQFLRSRHGVGDGSDLSRISSQQVFLSSLIRQLQSDAVLTDVGRLYQISQVATQNMTLSTSLNDIGTMVAMARVLADIPLDTMQFIQYPTAARGDGRVVPIEGTADEVMELIAADQEVILEEDSTGSGSTTETPAPTDPATGYEIDEETGLPIDPESGFPINSDTGLPYDPETGFTIDASTGWAYDEATGTYWNPETGNQVDPSTGQDIDAETGYPIDETTGWPIDPATGWPIDPDTGQPTDPSTITPEDEEPTALPGVQGQNADQETCVVPFGY